MRNDEWLYYGITSLKVHNNLKCSNNSKHCQWPGIKLTEHRRIWSMKTINILVHTLGEKKRFDVRQMQSKCGSNKIFVAFVGI